MSGLRRVVIVGASVAGVSAADALREDGFDGAITLIGDEPDLPYDRPPLSKQVLWNATGEESEYPLRPRSHYADNGVDLLLGSLVTGLDADRRVVRLGDGAEVPYDGVVVATGCRARELTVPGGLGLPVLRTLSDARWLAAAATAGVRVVLVGGGFIGLEVAASLRGRGCEVTVLEAAPLALAATMGEEVAAAVCRDHADHGVRILGGVRLDAVRGGQGGYRVELADGRTLDADLVLIGVGVTPNDGWLADSPVACADGVVCDEWCFTSVERVVAAGDVCRWENPRYGSAMRVEHWTHAVEQGRVAAQNLLRGRDGARAYPSVPYFWSDQYGRKLQAYGRLHPGDHMIVVEGRLTSDEFVALYGSNGTLHLVLGCNRPRSLRPYRRLVQRNGSWADAIALAHATVGAAGC